MDEHRAEGPDSVRLRRQLSALYARRQERTLDLKYAVVSTEPARIARSRQLLAELDEEIKHIDLALREAIARDRGISQAPPEITL